MPKMDIQIESRSNNGNGTTFLRTCFNGINLLAGIGVLSIPYAMSEGGSLSVMILFAVAVICCYTALLLQKCSKIDPTIRTYPDIGHRAFGYIGRALLSTFMCLELYLVAVEFLILEGDNLHKLFPHATFHIGGYEFGGKKTFVVLSALVILPTTWLQDLGLMAYVSAGGVFASMILFFSVLWVGAIDGVGFHEEGAILKWSGLPTSISLYTVCYCGHAVFPMLRNSMQDSKEFSKVLFACFTISTISYGSMGIIGYMMYGDNLDPQITLNLPISYLSSKIAIYTTLINPITKYAMIISPVAAAIEGMLPNHNGMLIRCIVRMMLLVSTVVTALFVPYFGFIMAFIGSFLGINVSILFPSLCYMKIRRIYKSFGLEMVIIVVICVLGCFFSILGTYTSIIQLLASHD